MIPIMEFQDRSLKGPVMKADDFDLAFAMKVRELVDKYNIEYPSRDDKRWKKDTILRRPFVG